MGGSGLVEVWVESGIMGQGTAEHALAGKSYNKAVRAHKLTWQALWTILLPDLQSYVSTELWEEIVACPHVVDIIDLIKQDRLQETLTTFVEERCRENVNFQFWWDYMNMVATLLMFIRAQREGNWELHLESFAMMMPYFMRYDHYNYARWGAVYLTEMHGLPDEVQSEFMKGNFVVKRSTNKFNQVDPDQAQEWINGTGKRGGGIVGITKTISALSRWTLSYNLRAHLSTKTREMFGIADEDSFTPNEQGPGRQTRDSLDEESLITTFKRLSVFPNEQSNTLQNIATKDVATEAIKESLINAQNLGQLVVDQFVQERMHIDISEEAPKMGLHQRLPRQNAPTFENLYKVTIDKRGKDQKCILKADRNVLQRLITAYEAGREVDMTDILKHELMPVPLSLAELNGALRTGNKSSLTEVLLSGIDVSDNINYMDACIIIDGQAVVAAMGKPAEAKVFGDVADAFINTVMHIGRKYKRIDLVFDRYEQESIKNRTRKRRSKAAQPIRRIIESRDVPIPKSWPNFMALPANKADLSNFLSEEVLQNVPHGKVVVVSGGFTLGTEVRPSNSSIDITCLKANHEEADTRLVLHAINCEYETVAVYSSDTDVLLLLVSHFAQAMCSNMWMVYGTAKNRKHIPIAEVAKRLPIDLIEALLPYHAMTGCDTTSYIATQTKRSTWKVFLTHHQLLRDLGEGELTEEKQKKAEEFVCKVYKVQQIDNVDTARHIMFSKSKKPEALPPTRDALHFHIMRAHYQAMIWKKANTGEPDLPDPTEMGWKKSEGGLEPILMSLNPIPEACLEVIFCSCKTNCRTLRCKCRKSGLQCTRMCVCKKTSDDLCLNKQ